MRHLARFRTFRKQRALASAAALCVLILPALDATEVDLRVQPDCPPAHFAASEIESALTARGLTSRRQESISAGSSAGHRIALTLDTTKAGDRASQLQTEGFAIHSSTESGSRSIVVIGRDAGGLMYGGLELAEQIRIGGLDAIESGVQNPYMARRGTKFNIPLDARTPSYTDVCDSAQQNIPVMWEFEFWQDYIDNLARHRYNTITLWNLHPFPSMVRVPDYPEVALDDVKRSTVAWKENYDLQARGFDAPEILANLETVKHITIDEKIEFWRRVMRYAKDRNIDFHVVTWNIFVNGTEGKYGITDKIDNPTTTDYFRKSVRAMFDTYPDLAGIGLTTGENMPGVSAAQKAEWVFNTYGQGVLDAAAAQPERRFVLIHRQHMTGASEVVKRFATLRERENVEFLFSFKYAEAHVMSSTRQPFSDRFVEDIRKAGMQTFWTLRNDDNYHFRWGAPDFVREFIERIPYDVSRGFYYGSDQWIWGREFLSLAPRTPRQLEIDKHWYHWMLWGRLGYDPELSNERIVAILGARYPEVPADKLFDAWQSASMIYPLVTGFHWGALDFQWYIEGCKSRPEPAQTESGFHDVNRFITLKPHPGTDNISIPDYVAAVVEGKQIQGTTPLEVAQRVEQAGRDAVSTIQAMLAANPADLNEIQDQELREILDDIHAMANLGEYYGHKIRGATQLALYRKTKDPEHKIKAIDELTQAATAWKAYVAASSARYKNPLWTNRVGYVNWDALTEEVENDIQMARDAE